MKFIPFKENEFSIAGKAAIYSLILIATGSATLNIVRGVAVTPEAFTLVVLGLVLFLVSKVRVILKGTLVSFGTKPMSRHEANIYRFGYWLMVVGVMFTFVG